MNYKRILSLLALVLVVLTASAQRFMDRLDRGIVAMKTTGGIFVSWRIQPDEYYDVTYNLYRDGVMIAEKLNVSNYKDAAGTTSSKYSVEKVLNGVKKEQSAQVGVWAQDYLSIKPQHAKELTATYVPNDACCADVDGDGQVEILMKYNNSQEANNSYPKEGYNGEYSLFECLKLDGTVLWWVNCGPNMGDFQNNEQNIVGYDWDMDGKAEVVMRLCEGATIHMADGTVYEVKNNDGTGWYNYRVPKSGGTEWFTHYGDERLLYVNGATGKPYVDMEYPLKRLEDSEWDKLYLHSGSLATFESCLSAAWGDGYGHRSNKFFFGAPYLDGRKPSIFLGRGIYTRHKFIALDVDPTTHKLTTRWTWNNNTSGPWKGQGYHNYAIVDVDWDGRDEIVWGSMVIDDNGKGLSTTGLGHGDAQHHGDLDPYKWGQEGFFCNEDQPANNYRDLTTSKIYHRYAASGDDGRAIAGNFCNDFPGAMGFSAHENAISCVTGEVTSGMTKTGVGMNFRCYWDGDLCEETFNGGDNTPGNIYKYGKGSAIKTFIGLTNNSTKATPCFMGDIFGDWREEFILRTSDNNLVIYSTTIPTTWRNYSLWYDHQYRNGMVWEPCGYNQPPHTSYFLGELENITAAPPALTMQGRDEVTNGSTIGADANGKSVITCETNDMTVSVADGATPYIYIDNAPTWVQGWAASNTSAANNPSNIKYATYTHTLTGGAFAGDMRLVKQGDGMLVLPDVVQKYTGMTEVWAGSLAFSGTMQSSKLWLNRHTTLYTDGGTFTTIQADYNATIVPGGATPKAGTVNADEISLGFGAAVELDIYSEGLVADMINAKTLVIENKTWPNGSGPEYNTPVFRIIVHPLPGESIADGMYLIGNVGTVKGSLSDIVIENLTNQKATLIHQDGKLYLKVENFAGAPVTWVGNKSSEWNLDKDANFKDNTTGEETTFQNGSAVTFNDDAASFNVKINGNVSPAMVTFDNSKAYTLSGDSIAGSPEFSKQGKGTLTISNVNHLGDTEIMGGTLAVASLANKIGTDYGSLGSVDKYITIGNDATLSVTSTQTSGHEIVIANGNARINVASGTLTQVGNISVNGGNQLTKIGSGSLTLPAKLSFSKLIIQGGNVNTVEASSKSVLPATVEFRGGTLTDTNSEGSYTTNSANFVVPEGYQGTLILDPRCDYTGKLTGAGTFTVSAAGVRNTLSGNWSDFEGELVVKGSKRGSYDPSFDWNNTYGLPYATLNVQSGYEFKNGGKAMKLKAIKDNAEGTISGTGTITLGEGYDADMTIANVIKSPVTYKGEEGHEMIVQNAYASNITCNLTISSGALRIVGTSRAANQKLFNPNYTTTLSGSGKMYGAYMYLYAVNIASGGELSVTGMDDAVTTAKFTGPLNVRSGGVVDMKIASASSNSKITSAGTMMFWTGSKLRVRLADGYTPAKGASFTLWTTTGTLSGDATKCTVELPTLPVGLMWDTTALFAQTGVITVVEDPSEVIENVAPDRQLQADVIALDGRNLGRISTTKAGLHEAVKAVAPAPGSYVVKFISGTVTDNITVSVK